jgi:hypothetical protein
MASDCTACQALCCVVLAFDRSELFAFDKPAGVPCPQLSKKNRCRIHDELEEHGMAGCARYDCDGAGPRACAATGASWREGDEAMRRLYDAFGFESQSQRNA